MSAVEATGDGEARRAAILAGGRGSRIGASKATVLLAGRPLASYPADAAREAGLDPFFVAKAGTPLPDLGIEVVAEPDTPVHPLAGIVAALEHAAAPIVVLACDLPFLTPPLLVALATRPEPLVVPADPRPQPLVARWSPELLPACARHWQPRPHSVALPSSSAQSRLPPLSSRVMGAGIGSSRTSTTATISPVRRPRSAPESSCCHRPVASLCCSGQAGEMDPANLRTQGVGR